MKQFRHIAMHSDGENYNKINVKRNIKRKTTNELQGKLEIRGKNQQNSLHSAET